MDRTSYVAPIVEAYIPDASIEEKLALTAEILALFDALYEQAHTPDRFDSLPPKMVESDSHEVVVAAHSPWRLVRQVGTPRLPVKRENLGIVYRDALD